MMFAMPFHAPPYIFRGVSYAAALLYIAYKSLQQGPPPFSIMLHSPNILKHIIYDTYKSTRAGEEERSPPKFRNSAKSLGLLFLSLLTPTHVLSLRV